MMLLFFILFAFICFTCFQMRRFFPVVRYTDPVLLLSESGFADFGLEASRLSTSDGAGFIVVGKISAHSDRTHHLPFFQDQDTTSHRRNATSRDGIKSRPECGSIYRPLCHRSPPDPHPDRPPGFGQSAIWS